MGKGLEHWNSENAQECRLNAKPALIELPGVSTPGCSRKPRGIRSRRFRAQTAVDATVESGGVMSTVNPESEDEAFES
jgi:hypothetical protein